MPGAGWVPLVTFSLLLPVAGVDALTLLSQCLQPMCVAAPVVALAWVGKEASGSLGTLREMSCGWRARGAQQGKVHVLPKRPFCAVANASQVGAHLCSWLVLGIRGEAGTHTCEKTGSLQVFFFMA